MYRIRPRQKQLILMDAGHSFKATEDMGKKSYKIRQSWQSSNPSEAGTGGRKKDVDMQPWNVAGTPLMISNRKALSWRYLN